ncbi:MAG: 5-carboxymethyl-2-hydroxymuconate isomerase [Hyphomicrobiales bacterium]|nr:5-carboxymethyl-2-hydroxymuconate isomerase [Hyphomicrobiales bacterium]
MPHVIVEYSANLEADLDPRKLIGRIHKAVVETGVYPLGGVRVRAARRELCIVADGDPENAFVAVLIRMGQGRDAETRRRVSKDVLAALADETGASFAKRGLSLSVEIQEIDEVGASRKNNLHERLKA